MIQTFKWKALIIVLQLVFMQNIEGLKLASKEHMYRPRWQRELVTFTSGRVFSNCSSGSTSHNKWRMHTAVFDVGVPEVSVSPSSHSSSCLLCSFFGFRQSYCSAFSSGFDYFGITLLQDANKDFFEITDERNLLSIQVQHHPRLLQPF